MSDRMFTNDTGGNGGMSLAGFLLGAAVGAGLALLLAPAPGGETRKKLGETARRIGDRASEMKRRATETEPST
jgi:gas vesicle protein